MTTTAADPTTAIRRFLGILHGDGGVIEVRAPNAVERRGGTFTSTWAGYFDDLDAAAAAIARLDEEAVAPSLYVTLNPVRPDLLARGANRMRFKARETTADDQVTRRRWLLIDLDPDRPAGISATDAELALARERAAQVRADLDARGWPDPVVLASGNGVHLLYRIDLPADDEGLVGRVLDALAEQHDDERVKVDTSNRNAARITKVGGTVARKGDDFAGTDAAPARPHRRAEIIAAPDEAEIVPTEALEAIAGPKPEPVRSPMPARGVRPSAGGTRFATFDMTPEGVRGYLESHGVGVRKVIAKGDETVIALDACPVDPSCTATGETDIAVLVNAGGRVAFRNQHNRGTGLEWIDVREALEPGYREHVERARDPRPASFVEPRDDRDHGRRDPGPETPPPASEEPRRVEPPRTVAENLDALLTGLRATHGRKRLGLALSTLTELDSRLCGLRGFMLLAAAPNVGKTSLAMQVGVEVAEANPEAAVVVLSYEMSGDELETRLLSQLAQIPYRELKLGSSAGVRRVEPGTLTTGTEDPLDHLILTPKHRDALEGATATLRDLGRRFSVVDLSTSPGTDFEEVRATIEAAVQAAGCREVLVVIDNLQALAQRLTGRWSNEVERDNAALAHLLALQHALDQPLLLIAEQNKAGMGEADLTSARGTARAVYSPDVVMFLVTDPRTDDEETPPPAVPVDLVIRKARDGATRGTLPLTFIHGETRFEENPGRESFAKRARRETDNMKNGAKRSRASTSGEETTIADALAPGVAS